VDKTDTKITTNISRKTVESLPRGTTFSGLLVLQPGASGAGGQFQIDGSSGVENVFVIDGTEVTNVRSGATNQNNSVFGRTIAMAEPAYPADAQGAKGKVEVRIEVDRDGTIVSAKAVSGPNALRQSAEAAAMLSKFAPVHIDRVPIRMTGTIVYNFKSPKTTEVLLKDMKARPLSDEDRLALKLSNKLHFQLYRLVRSGASSDPGKEITVEVRPKKNGSDISGALRAAGFAVINKTDRGAFVGKIAISKLAGLAAIDNVELVLPRY
jgi:TonB family protein